MSPQRHGEAVHKRDEQRGIRGTATSSSVARTAVAWFQQCLLRCTPSSRHTWTAYASSCVATCGAPPRLRSWIVSKAPHGRRQTGCRHTLSARSVPRRRAPWYCRVLYVALSDRDVFVLLPLQSELLKNQELSLRHERELLLSEQALLQGMEAADLKLSQYLSASCA